MNEFKTMASFCCWHLLAPLQLLDTVMYISYVEMEKPKLFQIQTTLKQLVSILNLFNFTIM